MTPTRRDFVRVAGAVGTGLAVGGTAACVPDARPGPRASNPPAPKRLLILGGTGFIGPHMVRYAQGRGHEVSIFTRGRSETELPDSPA